MQIYELIWAMKPKQVRAFPFYLEYCHASFGTNTNSSRTKRFQQFRDFFQIVITRSTQIKKGTLEKSDLLEMIGLDAKINDRKFVNQFKEVLTAYLASTEFENHEFKEAFYLMALNELELDSHSFEKEANIILKRLKSSRESLSRAEAMVFIEAERLREVRRRIPREGYQEIDVFFRRVSNSNALVVLRYACAFAIQNQVFSESRSLNIPFLDYVLKHLNEHPDKYDLVTRLYRLAYLFLTEQESGKDFFQEFLKEFRSGKDSLAEQAKLDLRNCANNFIALLSKRGDLSYIKLGIELYDMLIAAGWISFESSEFTLFLNYLKLLGKNGDSERGIEFIDKYTHRFRTKRKLLSPAIDDAEFRLEEYDNFYGGLMQCVVKFQQVYSRYAASPATFKPHGSSSKAYREAWNLNLRLNTLIKKTNFNRSQFVNMDARAFQLMTQSISPENPIDGSSNDLGEVADQHKSNLQRKRHPQFPIGRYLAFFQAIKDLDSCDGDVIELEAIGEKLREAGQIAYKDWLLEHLETLINI